MKKNNSYTPFLNNPNNPAWRYQFERLQRFYKRTKNCDSKDYLDFVYAFFQNSYHLKDWIKHSGRLNNFDNLWDSFEKSNISIKLCRDICNGTKHLTLTHKPSVDGNFAILKTFDPYSRTEKWALIYQEKTKSVNELMSECIKAWQAFISSNLS